MHAKTRVMTPSWDDLNTVLCVVRGKTLAAAGQALGVNYTTVARRIARLESCLGTELFEKRPEGYHPTDAALQIAEHARQMEQSQDAMLRVLIGQDKRLSGKVTLTAPQLLIAHALGPMIAEFRETYPDIDLRVRATNDLLDLTRREADLAIRISRDPGDTLKGLKLTEQANAAYATRDWAKRLETDPTGMVDWIVYEGYPNIPNGSDHARHPNQRVHVRVDDMVAIVGLAEAGLGIARIPVFLGRSLPNLVRVPILPTQEYAPIWALAHPDVWPSSRVAALRGILVPYFKQRQSDFLT